MSKPTLGLNASARDLALLAAGDRRDVELSHITLEQIGGRLASFDYSARDLILRHVTTPADGRAPLGTSAESAQARDVELDFGNLRLRADRVEFPEGVSFADRRSAFAPHATLENLRVTIDDFAALGGGDDDSPAEPKTPPRPKGLTDYTFLDAIEGRLNVDLFVDTTIPLLGRRRATHHFRVPIDAGTVDYHGIEDSLHWLEDAFLDLEVLDGKLVLEQDLPLVPFSGKALLWWNLDAKELELARQRRVRLRTLMNWELPPEPKKKKKSSVDLHALALRQIDVDLSLSRPAVLVFGDIARVELGTEEQPGAVELTLAGDLHQHTRRSLEPTEVELSLRHLSAGRTELFFDAVNLAASSIDLGPLEDVKIGFEGFRPRSLTGRIAAASIRDLRVDF